MYRLLCIILLLPLAAGCGRKVAPGLDVQRVPQELEGKVQETRRVRDLGGGWVEAIGEAYLVNITPKEAKRQALQDAREQAIMYAVGVRIQSEILDILSTVHESFTDISQHTSSGKIVEEETPGWESYSIEDPAGGLPITVYRCFLKAKVAKEKGFLTVIRKHRKK